MKKKKIAAVLAIVTITSGVVSAKLNYEKIKEDASILYPSTKTINVESGPSLYIDSQLFIPTNVYGERVETFIYNGTTYVPIRAVSESFDKEVFYDSTTNSVIINSKPNSLKSHFRTYELASNILLVSERIKYDCDDIRGLYGDFATDYDIMKNYYQSYLDIYENRLLSRRTEISEIEAYFANRKAAGEVQDENAEEISKLIELAKESLQQFEKLIDKYKKIQSENKDYLIYELSGNLEIYKSVVDYNYEINEKANALMTDASVSSVFIY